MSVALLPRVTDRNARTQIIVGRGKRPARMSQAETKEALQSSQAISNASFMALVLGLIALAVETVRKRWLHKPQKKVHARRSARV
jgi:hypothetical protein